MGNTVTAMVGSGARPPERTCLTDDEVDRFRSDGFVAVARPLVSADDLAAAGDRLRAVLDDSLRDGSFQDLGDGTPGRPQIHEVPHASRRDPALLRTTAYRTLAQLARETLGCDRVRHHFDHVILKPPRTDAETGWHQDIWFDPDHDDPMATVWLSFVDVDDRSGCMHYLPGSQHLPVRAHVRTGRDGHRVTEIDATGAVACPLPAGGVSIHGARTLHGSSGNRSDAPRLAWIVKFVPEDRSRPRVAARRALERVGLRQPAA